MGDSNPDGNDDHANVDDDDDNDDGDAAELDDGCASDGVVGGGLLLLLLLRADARHGGRISACFRLQIEKLTALSKLRGKQTKRKTQNRLK